MAKEILLYTSIYSWTAISFIESMEENKGKEITIRMNTPGGDPVSAWGMIAKMKEHPKAVNVKVDGQASSMGLYMLPYAKNVEALDVSTFLLHRAAYVYGEQNLTEAEVNALAAINADLRKALEGKIDEKKLKKLKGVTLDEVFDLTKRIDVTLTAAEALEIGLIDKINPINKEEMAALNEMLFAATATQTPKPTEQNPKLNNKVMTIETLKAEKPELYAQIVALGVAKEKDRVKSWMAFNHIDTEAVATGINGGEELSASAMAEFTVKGINKALLAKAEGGNPAPVTTDTPQDKGTTDAKAQAVAAFEAEVRANLKA